MTKKEFNAGLLAFLDASPTPFHATEKMVEMFDKTTHLELVEHLKKQTFHLNNQNISKIELLILHITFLNLSTPTTPKSAHP